VFDGLDIRDNARYTFGGVWLIYINIAKFEYDRIRGRNQYNHVRRVLFEIFFYGSLECIDIGESERSS
jgi:hypothetical protein